MVQYGFVIDISRCIGCYCCFTACKDEYWDNDYPPYTTAQPQHGQSWMNIAKNERGKFPYVKAAFMPLPCMQCEDAPCVKASKNGAVYARPDGVVVIDPKKAAGQKQLLTPEACPYGVIFWNDRKNLPQKCTFCAHRLEEGKIPRCAQACPSGSLTFGDLDDPQSAAAKLLKATGAAVFHPEWKTKPRVYYIDLHKMTSNFIAGAVVFSDSDECAEGVKATLSGNGKSVKTTTNNYGNFEFDGLDNGKYTVTLERAGYTPKKLDIELKTDNYLGEIVLEKR
jgi:Fe-S-cluster-containing dehydrogenase component